LVVPTDNRMNQVVCLHCHSYS